MRWAFWKNFAGLQHSQLKLKTLINLVLRSQLHDEARVVIERSDWPLVSTVEEDGTVGSPHSDPLTFVFAPEGVEMVGVDQHPLLKCRILGVRDLTEVIHLLIEVHCLVAETTCMDIK